MRNKTLNLQFINNLHDVEETFTANCLKAPRASTICILKSYENYCVARKLSMLKRLCLAKISKTATFTGDAPILILVSVSALFWWYRIRIGKETQICDANRYFL